MEFLFSKYMDRLKNDPPHMGVTLSYGIVTGIEFSAIFPQFSRFIHSFSRFIHRFRKKQQAEGFRI